MRIFHSRLSPASTPSAPGAYTLARLLPRTSPSARNVQGMVLLFIFQSFSLNFHMMACPRGFTCVENHQFCHSACISHMARSCSSGVIASVFQSSMHREQLPSTVDPNLSIHLETGSKHIRTFLSSPSKLEDMRTSGGSKQGPYWKSLLTSLRARTTPTIIGVKIKYARKHY